MTEPMRKIQFGGQVIEYSVNFIPTRQTLSIEVHPNQQVVVRAPSDCQETVIAERVQRRASWISRQISDFQRYKPRTPPRQFVSGETHMYLGRQYRLKICAGDASSIKLPRGYLIVTLNGKPNSEQVEAVLRRWYLDRARTVFSEVIGKCLPRFKLQERPALIVREMRSRWGSLSVAGTMTLNVNLIRAPRACIEYVVIHELCHMIHRNHDAAFFRQLEQVLPNWQAIKARLEVALL